MRPGHFSTPERCGAKLIERPPATNRPIRLARAKNRSQFCPQSCDPWTQSPRRENTNDSEQYPCQRWLLERIHLPFFRSDCLKGLFRCAECAAKTRKRRKQKARL